MKVLFDTNVIIDVLAKREPFYIEALQLLRFVEVKKLEGFLTATTITDIMYILRKYMAREKLYETVQILLSLFQVITVSKSDIRRAFVLPMADYEDSLQVQCARKEKVDYIVTRNGKDFEKSPVRAISPQQLCDLLK